MTAVQQRTCLRHGAEYLPAEEDHKLGISEGALRGDLPLHGLRHPPEAGTCGWFIWAGEEHSEADDFFKSIHVMHLKEDCPAVLPYLALASGWRFLIAYGYEDIWFDPSLLRIKHRD